MQTKKISRSHQLLLAYWYASNNQAFEADSLFHTFSCKHRIPSTEVANTIKKCRMSTILSRSNPMLFFLGGSISRCLFVFRFLLFLNLLNFYFPFCFLPFVFFHNFAYGADTMGVFSLFDHRCC